MLYGYYLFLSTVPSEKRFKIVSSVYLLLIFLSSLKGQRALFLLSLLLVLTFYYLFYNKKISVRVISFLGISIMLFSQFIRSIRVENAQFVENNIIFEFMRQQGVSFLIPGLLIENSILLNREGVPYLFAPLIDSLNAIRYPEVFSKGQTEELLDISNYLGYELMYFLYPDGYLKGWGVGSNYLAELIGFGGITAVIVFHLLLFPVISKIVKLMSVRRIYIVIFIPILISLYYMPRSSLLGFKLEPLKIILIYLLFTFAASLFSKVKNRDRKNKQSW